MMNELPFRYCVSLGSPPRIAVLTAGYKGLSKIVKIKSMLLLLVAAFTSLTDGKGFVVDLGVSFFNFCQATASTLNSFPSSQFGFFCMRTNPRPLGPVSTRSFVF